MLYPIPCGKGLSFDQRVRKRIGYNPALPTQLDSVNLQTVNEGSLVSAGYTYHPGNRRVQTLSRPLTGGAALVGTSAWDAAGRLKSVAWTRGSSAVASYEYQLNSAGLRSVEIRQDGTKLEYGYNDRGELVSAVRKRTANESVRPDWSHGYQYRDNGNRASISTPEGETLNYTFSNVSSGVNVGISPSPTKQWLRGRAHPDAEVKVGTGTAEREGDLWRYLWTNPAPPAAQQATVTATRSSLTPGPIPGNQSWTLPGAATLYQYDLRGNLSQDAHWLYTWDAENRLVVQEQKYPGTATDGARAVKRLEFSYDAMGRRISKKLLVSQKLSSGQLVGTWSFSKETVFIWQDWVLLAEFVKTSSGGNFELRRSYLWGLDVNGSLGGAGGVGGLLWVADYVPGQAASNRQLAPWYDGNGNVMGWMENDGAQPLPQHRLEYDPYGKLLVDDTVRPTLNQKQRNLGVAEEWPRSGRGVAEEWPRSVRGVAGASSVCFQHKV
jgi:hypothetical protein